MKRGPSFLRLVSGSMRIGALLGVVACAKSPASAQSTGGTLASAPEPADRQVLPLPPTAPSAEPSPTLARGNVTNDATWTIEFQASQMSTLRNGTQQGFWILHDNYLQPSLLEVRGVDGKHAPSFDTRTNKKFDNTVRQSAYRRIESGAELPLFQLRVVECDAEFELRWGPFRIGPLPAGKYSATVSWQAHETQYFDDASGQKRTLEGAFVGSVRSPATAFELPLR